MSGFNMPPGVSPSDIPGNTDYQPIAGGLAFPCAEYGELGMTLRDYFAAAAMQGFCADHTRDQVENLRTLAGYAYEMADAMLKARKK